ncbi:hypothetical protein DASC09_060020 [Saccharomycopsis crataegensis]|uniref:Auxin efflux carrier n=1 Tax=Saccharomycopsis crataegensis TaxID=43959 RepID=A0AAV5QUY6_9ASCO|nr:hypothetical protein DASC09_060020 [Saccharomycopsis crataegensis]
MADDGVSLSLSTAIWSSVKPILKIYFIIFTGFLLTRKNILTVETSRNLSDLVVTVALPALTFSKLVSNISYQDAESIGVLSFVCFLVMGMGGILGLGVNYITPAPKVFFYGLISCGMFTNISDLPIAFIQGIPPVVFDTQAIDKGVAYVCIFLFAEMFVFFNLGCNQLLGLDFKTQASQDTDTGDGSIDDNASTETENHIQASTSARSQASSNLRSVSLHASAGAPRRVNGLIREYSEVNAAPNYQGNDIDPLDQLSVVRTRTRQSQNIAEVDGIEPRDSESLEAAERKSFAEKYHLTPILFVLSNFKRPASMSILLGLIVAIVPWLKALFVQYDNHVDYPNSPDGNPPLHFIIDITTHVGNAQVPLGLIILGGTLGRVESKSISKGLVITALCLALVRLVILPIIGVTLMTKFRNMGWFQDDMAMFLAILNWGLPSMTTIIYIIAFFTPLDGPYVQMDCVAVILMVQYFFLVISFPILTTFTLKHSLGY